MNPINYTQSPPLRQPWVDNLVQGTSAENLFDKVYLYALDTSLSNNEFWNSLTDSQKLALISNYESEVKNPDNLYGLIDTYTYNPEDILADLEELSKLDNFSLEKPTYESISKDVERDINPYYDDAKARALESYNTTIQSLDDNLARTRKTYDDQFKTMNELYSQASSNLLSNQYLSNAQTFDTMQSDMRRARQNALEAGASAGVRIAGNVNAILSAQNKQSATAMETSNALAEMLLQQRNAAAGLRSEYGKYMSDTNTAKANAKTSYNNSLTDLDTDYRTELSDRTNNRYQNEMSDYTSAKQDWENQFTNLTNKGNSLASPYQTWLTRR